MKATSLIQKIVTGVFENIYKKDPLISSKYNYSVYSSGKRNTFYGYFDKTPFNYSNTKILACSVDSEIKPTYILGNNIPLEVGYFNIDTPDKFIKLGSTFSWCWQQGPRLMWIPGEKDSVIFNSYDGEKYISIEMNITNEKKRTNSFPVYDISSDGHNILSLNFSRLGKLRPGYGYINREFIRNESYDEDGIWLCNRASGVVDLIINLEELCKQMGYLYQIEEGDIFYINHLSFNPSGNRFVFFLIKNGKRGREVKAFTSDLTGRDLFLLNGGRMLSHFTWIDDSTLLATTQGLEKFGYYILKDKTGLVERYELGKYSGKDGHPSKIKTTVLSDTYPLGFLRKQSVWVYANGLKEMLNVITPIIYKGETRCDLHPRFSGDGKMICIDVPGRTGRKMAVIRYLI